ncbi:MAG: CAAD domain-containing protein [Synechococcales bacterium]|nr:CAAD domain-containing protein [Synechococcales bacterium]
MEPEEKQGPMMPNVDADTVQVEVEGQRTSAIEGVSATQSKEQWQKLGEQTSRFLSELPAYVGEFFNEYRRPLLTIGLILAIVLFGKIALAILGAINDVPLLAPSLELIGIGYVIWFVFRYLLKASTRSELANDFGAVKSQVLGERDKLLDRFASKSDDI